MKKAFTFIEMLVVVMMVVVLAGMAVPICYWSNHKTIEHKAIERLGFKVGDKVVINGLSVTGVVDTIYASDDVCVIANTPNGLQWMNINPQILTKIK